MIGRTVVQDLNDPFNAVTFDGSALAEDHARLSDEAFAISMMGGDRLIRIRDAGDKIAPIVKSYLENPATAALVVIEAGGLGPSSKLRKLCESEKNAATLPCYVEDSRDLSRLIRDTLQESNIRIQPDAVTFLASRISGDRARARSEIEKLALYKGFSDTTPITLEEAQHACGGAGEASLDSLVMSVGSGNVREALEHYDHLMREDVNFIVILRSLQNHFLKLHLVRSALDAGKPMDEAVKALRPPLFFKTADSFKAQARAWDFARLDAMQERLYDLEAQCKQTGAPVETLCGQAILGMSATAARLR